MSADIKKFTESLGGSAIMLNIYRVISLSLVTALFFAAPLLCVQPISFQIKKAQHSQDKRVRVVSQRATYNPHKRNVTASWARSIHRTAPKTFHLEGPVSIRDGDENLYENHRSNSNAAREDNGITASYTDL